MDDARGDLDIVEAREAFLGFGKGVQKAGLGEDPGVIMHLERSDSRRDVDHARQGSGLKIEHQGMDAQAQLDIEGDGPIFDQQIAVALAPIDHTRPLALGGDLAQDRRRVGQR